MHLRRPPIPTLCAFVAAVGLALLPPPVVAIQGDSQCSDALCVHAFRNETEWTYQLEARVTGENLGWMALGFGSSMVDSAMIIMWPNSDGSFTLSHRYATAREQPKFNHNPPRVARVYQPLTAQTSSRTLLSFAIPPNGQLQQPIIWALSTTRPRSSAPDAEIARHVVHGQMRLDLSQEFAAASSMTQPQSGDPTGSAYQPPGATNGLDDLPVFELPPLMSYQRMLVAHAVLCSLGFLLVLPIGALVGRWLRMHTPHWFKIHWILQAGIAGPLIIIGWAIGIVAIAEKGGTHFDDTHKVAGLVLLGAYILQMMLGIHIHFFKPKAFARPIPKSAMTGSNPLIITYRMLVTSPRPIQNYMHAVIGILIIAIAFYNVWLGIWTEWPAATGRGDVSQGIKNMWTAWIVIIPLIYVGGLWFLPRQLSQERRAETTTVDLPLKSGGTMKRSKSSKSAKSAKTTASSVRISQLAPVKADEEWKNRIEEGAQVQSDDGYTEEYTRETKI